jgi:hypothetical protein
LVASVTMCASPDDVRFGPKADSCSAVPALPKSDIKCDIATIRSPRAGPAFQKGIFRGKNFTKNSRRGVCTHPTKAILAPPPTKTAKQNVRHLGHANQAAPRCRDQTNAAARRNHIDRAAYRRQRDERKIQTRCNLRIKVAPNSFGDWSLSVLFCDQSLRLNTGAANEIEQPEANQTH